MSKKFTEEELEKAIIELFRDKEGYGYVYGKDIHREPKNILLEDDLTNYLQEKYADENLTENEIETIINRIKLVPVQSLYEANREIFSLLNSGFDLKRDDVAKPVLHVELIDFEVSRNNLFKVINQYEIEDNAPRIPDMLIFINGIPVCICEFKSAIKEGTTIYDAWLQIHNRYNRDLPNLMKYCMLSMITDGANSRLGSIFSPYEYYYAWRKINDNETERKGIASLITMISGALSKERILDILHDFIYYPDSSDKETAIVCRYPQYFATHKIVDSIKRHLKPEGDGKGGTYFGATGCGKTYTMLFVARKLMRRDNAKFNNPTILIIEDRDDLDTQTADVFTPAKTFLNDQNVRSVTDRTDLGDTLSITESGGVYITTIQKFCESIGLLSARTNIICLSDEAHRTQINLGSTIKVTEKGVKVTYGFAKYLRDSFPNATYVGFTGTPIDETVSAFGGIIDRYSMLEACEDGITVRIAYEPRLARVILNETDAKAIQQYYDKCTEIGSTPEQVEASKKAMSEMGKLLGHPERLKKMAADIVKHYEDLCANKPKVVQKAMIVVDDRVRAYKLWQEIIALRPEWNKNKHCLNEKQLSPKELEKLAPIEKIKIVATRDKNDEKKLYDLLGNETYRKNLAVQFKNDNSNFTIAIVVDMWITGFDVPSLSVMYIDKPIQKHTLIQTISRVNRVYPGKERGLVVDYIGILDELKEAMKQYGGDGPIDDLKTTLKIFRNKLDLLNKLMRGFDATLFTTGTSLEKLNCLNEAVEFVQAVKEREDRFMYLSRQMKAAFEICAPSGELSDIEYDTAQLHLAIRSIIYKQTIGPAPDTEIMNQHVEKMVQQAISCTGVENIINYTGPQDIFGDELREQVDQIKMPITKFNALLKLMHKAISSYSKVNRVKAIEFDKRLKEVVDKYNNRDKLLFTSEVVDDFVNSLSDELINIMNSLHDDKTSFAKMGISYEEKAFYDILIKVRDEHKFEYEDKKCIVLAKKIKELVDEKSKYTDWSTREDIKNKLNMDLTVLLYDNGYPPQWDDEVFEQVLSQAENFKKNAE